MPDTNTTPTSGGPDESAAPISERRSVRVPHSPAATAKVREALVKDLTQWQIPERILDEAELVLSEIFANAVRHAKPLADGMVRLQWKCRGEIVEVEVTDGGGPTEVRPAPLTTWAPVGRGLRIVRSLSHEWGVIEEQNGGRTVWASIGGPSRRRSH